MKLYYDINAPSPRRPRIVVAEKGIAGEIEWLRVDVPGRETRTPPLVARNPFGSVPVLELDDGTCLWESHSVSRYLERFWPEPNLFGVDAREEARVDMWSRRIEMMLYLGVEYVAGFRESYPEVSESYQRRVDVISHALDVELADKDFVVGERFTMADIVAICAIDYGRRWAGVEMTADTPNLHAWHRRMWERASVLACKDDYEGSV